MNTTEHNEIAPAEATQAAAETTTAAEACSDAAPLHAQVDAFPEVAPEPLRISVNVGAHKREEGDEIGITRLRILTPFALSRLGLPYEVWDAEKQAMVHTDRKLSVRTHAVELSKRLGCGTDLVFEWVALVAKKGPENIVGSELLKTASCGGKGTSRLKKEVEQALEAAVYEVCVEQGMKPGARKTNEKIRAALTAAGITAPVSNSVVNQRAHSEKITKARTDAYTRDHLHRIAGQSAGTPGLNSVVVIDTTTFTDEDSSLRVVDAQGRDLGPANVIFAVLKANRGVWSVRGFAGPQNSFLAGLTIKRGLVSKTHLLERYKIAGVWAHNGKVGSINHDCGSEFIARRLQDAIKRRGIAVDDRSPPKTPHYRGGLERFNRTAHLLFNEFLQSPSGKRYLRPVNGRPDADGIMLDDLDRALVEWVVVDYHVRPHAGLGGDSPFSRMEKYVRGENGLATSGLPRAVDDTDELKWDFLWEENRTITHQGINLHNRRYVDPMLSRLFNINSRSSKRKVQIRFQPYAMGQVFVKIPDENGNDVICPIPWLPETERYRPSGPNATASINPSLWEWKRLFADIRLGNTAAPTAELAEALFAKREAEAADAAGRTSGKTPKERISSARERALRGQFGKENLPGAAAEAAGDAEADRGGKKKAHALRSLDTRPGTEAYGD